MLGTWIGGYASNDLFTGFFFALAAAAALQVVIEVGRFAIQRVAGGLRSGWVIGGHLAGITIVWVTGAFAA